MMKPTYDPSAVESRWYSVWEDAGAFRPEVNPDGEPFSIVIPPPNVTGVLHMGHALDQSIQDVIIRRKRMQGYAALWLPGHRPRRHRHPERRGARTRHRGHVPSRPRSRTIRRTGVAWKARSGSRHHQADAEDGFLHGLDRERFTLDEGLSAAVREVFVTLYEEGLIYRGNRIINWCPRCQTALSDIEVEHDDEIGELTHITYPFTEGEGGVIVATTRPETMLGDTAVAVHPDDDRYRDSSGGWFACR